MCNVLLEVSINDLNERVKGILNKKTNIITYSDSSNTSNELFLNSNKLVRKNSEQTIFIDFNKSSISIEFNDKKSIKIPINVINIEKNETSFKAIYSINKDDVFEYKIVINKKC